MSFWSFIGLPDKNYIISLQNEIIRLNAKCDTVLEELSDIRAQINKYAANTQSELCTVHNNIVEINDTMISVKSDYDSLEQRFSEDMNRLNGSITTILNIDSDLSSLTEYVNCLWTSTKALWVDSLVSDLDNMIMEDVYDESSDIEPVGIFKRIFNSQSNS